LGGGGYGVVCVVDGLEDSDVERLYEFVQSVNSEVLVHLGVMTGSSAFVRVVATCTAVPRVLLTHKARDGGQGHAPSRCCSALQCVAVCCSVL